jgi:hypothetical protein
MNKLEFENGSVIESIDNKDKNTISKRGQEQLNKVILTKKDRLEAYEKIFCDDEDYINSFLNKDKYPINTYIDKEEKKPFFEGYKPPYYFKSDEEIDPDILSKAIYDSMKDYTKCTSMSSKAFTLDDLTKAMEKLEKLPPTPTKIEIGKYALNVLLEQIPKIDNTKYIGLPNMMYGLPIILYDGFEFNFNQARIKYNDGSSKILDVFKYDINTDLYKNIFREEF